MKKSILAFLLAAFLLPAASPRKPKLVVAVAIDQFRYDYLTRFRSEYTGGIARMLERGAVYTNAFYEHFPTVTAIGHSTYLTGATPSISGIVGNEWYDRETHRQVSSVSDEKSNLLGAGEGRLGASPHRLLVSTVGDELKMANGRSKIVGISSKDRSAILPAGRMADGAYWFDTASGNFVSSTFYFSKLPDWAARFNDNRVADQWLGKDWSPIVTLPEPKVFARLGVRADKGYFDVLDRTPYGNDLLELFAEAAIEGEQLGGDDITDILTLSFSANDRVGHNLGPDSQQIHDISVQTDRTLARLMDFVEKKVGVGNSVFILTADHGVAPLPEIMRDRKMPGGRMPEGTVLNTIQTALQRKFGTGDYVIGSSGPAPYLNYDLLEEKKISREDAQDVAAEALRALPHIYRVYTRAQLRRGNLLDDMIDRRVRAGFHAERGSDLFVVSDPYWLFESRGTSHGTPYNYDAHVPVIFMGSGIKSGKYHQRIAVNDIAPTLATMLEVETPSGAVGRVLYEMLE